MSVTLRPGQLGKKDGAAPPPPNPDLVIKTQVALLKQGGTLAPMAFERLLGLDDVGRKDAAERLAPLVFADPNVRTPATLSLAFGDEKLVSLATAYALLSGIDAKRMDESALIRLKTELTAWSAKSDGARTLLAALSDTAPIASATKPDAPKPVMSAAHPLAAKLAAGKASAAELDAVTTPGEQKALLASLLDQGIEPRSLLQLASPAARAWLVQGLADKNVFVLSMLPGGDKAALTAADTALREARAAVRETFKPGALDSAISAFAGIDGRTEAIATLKTSYAHAEAQLTSALKKLQVAREGLTGPESAKALLKAEEAALLAELAVLGGGPLGQALAAMERSTALLLAPPYPQEGQTPEAYADALLAYSDQLAKALQSDEAVSVALSNTAGGARTVLGSGAIEAFETHLTALRARGRDIDLALTMAVSEGAVKKDLAFNGELTEVGSPPTHVENGKGKTATQLDADARKYVDDLFGTRLAKMTDAEVPKEIDALHSREWTVQKHINGLTQEIAFLRTELARVKDDPTQRRYAMELSARLDKDSGLPAQVTLLQGLKATYKRAEQSLTTRYQDLGVRLNVALQQAGLAALPTPTDRAAVLAGAKQLSVLTGGPFGGVTAGGPFGEVEAELAAVAKHANEKRTQLHFSYVVPLLKERFGVSMPSMPVEFAPMFDAAKWAKVSAADQQKIAAGYEKWFEAQAPKAMQTLRTMLGLTGPMDEASLGDLYKLVAGGDTKGLQSPFMQAFQAYLEKQAWFEKGDLAQITARLYARGETKISFGELRRIAGDTTEPRELRDVARKLVQNPNAFAAFAGLSGKVTDAATISSSLLVRAETRVGEYQSLGEGMAAGRVPASYVRPGMEALAKTLIDNEAGVGTLVDNDKFNAWYLAICNLSAEDKGVLVAEFDRQAGQKGAFYEKINGFYGASRGRLLNLFYTSETVDSYADKILKGEKTSVRVPVIGADEKTTISDGDVVDLKGPIKAPDAAGLSFRFTSILQKTHADLEYVDSGAFSWVNSDLIAGYKSKIGAAEQAVADFEQARAQYDGKDPRVKAAALNAAKALAAARLAYADLRWCKVEGDASVTRMMRSVVMPVAVTGIVAATVFATLPSGGTAVPVGAAGVAAAIAWGTAAGVATAAVIAYGTEAMKGTADFNLKEANDMFAEGAFTAATSAVSFAVPIAALGRMGAWAARGVGFARYMQNPIVRTVVTAGAMGGINVATTVASELASHKLQDAGALPKGEQQSLTKSVVRAGVSGFVLGLVAGPMSKLAPVWARAADAGVGGLEAAAFEMIVNQRRKFEDVFPAVFNGAITGVVAGHAMARYHTRASFETLNAKARIGVDGDVISIPRGDKVEGGYRIAGIRMDGTVEVFKPSAPDKITLVSAAEVLALNQHIETRQALTGRDVKSGDALPLGKPMDQVEARVQPGRVLRVSGKETGVVAHIDADTGIALIETQTGTKRMTAAELLKQNPDLLSGLPLEGGLRVARDEQNRAQVKGGDLLVVDAQGNARWVSIKKIARQNLGLLMPTVESPAAPALQSGRRIAPPDGEAGAVSAHYASSNRIEAGTTIPDGFADGGRGAKIKDGVVTSPREIIVVDTTRDPGLRAMLEQVETLRGLPEGERAATLIKYVHDLMNGGSEGRGILGRLYGWQSAYSGREVLLGEVPRLGGGACRQRALLLKILGDHIGLNVELVRGNAKFGNEAGGHAWNEIRLSDGTRYIADAMNPREDFALQPIDASVAKSYLGMDSRPLYTAASGPVAATGGARPIKVGAAAASEAPRGPALQPGAKLTIGGRAVEVFGFNADGALSVVETVRGNQFSVKSVGLDKVVAENSGIFDHVDVSWPLRPGELPSPGWRVSGAEDGKIFLTYSDAAGNILHLVSADASQVVLFNQAGLGTRSPFEIAVPPAPEVKTTPSNFADALRQAPDRDVLREMAKHFVGKDRLAQFELLQSPEVQALTPAERMAFVRQGETGMRLLRQAVADRQASLGAPEGSPARTQALAELRTLAAVADYTDGKTATTFARAWASPGADRAFLGKLTQLPEATFKKALDVYAAADQPTREFLKPRIDTLVKGDNPAGDLAALDKTVRLFGASAEADLFLAAYRGNTGKEKIILAKMLACDASTARLAFKLFGSDPQTVLVLGRTLSGPNAFEGVRAMSRIATAEARAGAKLPAEIAEALVLGATKPRTNQVTSAPAITPMQAGRAAEVFLRMPASEAKQLSDLLGRTSSAAEVTLIMKAAAARQDMLIGTERVPRDTALRELANFADAIRGRDAETLAYMTSLEAMRLDAASGGWVLEGGGKQIFTTSCGATIALIERANVDPITALRYRTDARAFEADQHRIMSREGVVFERKAEHMTPEQVALQGEIDDKFLAINALRKRLGESGALTNAEFAAFKEWQGRRGGLKGTERIENSAELRSLYEKLKVGLAQEGVSSFESFCFFLKKSTAGTDKLGAKVVGEGTYLDNYLNDVIGRYAGIEYNRVDVNRGGVLAQGDAIEAAVRNVGRVPIVVVWDPPGSGAHAMTITEVLFQKDPTGNNTRYFKILDPETGKSQFVTDAMLNSNDVVGMIGIGQGYISNIWIPHERPIATPSAKPVATRSAGAPRVDVAAGQPKAAVARDAPLQPAKEVNRLLSFGLSPKDTPVKNGMAMRADFAAEVMRGPGEITVGSLSLQAFRRVNTPHERGDAVIRALLTELKMLERQIPGFEIYAVGGKDITYKYTGNDRAGLEATLRSRFGPGGADASTVKRAIAKGTGRTDVSPEDIEFYVGMSKPIAIAKGADPLAVTRELVRIASTSGKQAQLEGTATVKEAGEARKSSFAIYDEEVVRKLSEKPEYRNELNPFGLDVSEVALRLAKAGSPDKLSPADQIALLLCQARDVPVGRAASDTFKSFMLADIEGGKTQNRAQVLLEGGDEIVIAATRNGQAEMAYLDLNAFGAVNGITSYPQDGHFAPLVRKLRLERGQDPDAPITGADLGDAIKKEIVVRLQKAATGNMQETLPKVAADLAVEMRADPHMAVVDKVKTKDFEIRGSDVTLNLGARRLEGRITGEGRMEVWDPAHPENKRSVGYDFFDGNLRLNFPEGRPGLSIAMVTLKKGDLATLTNTTGTNAEGFITAIADHYTETQKAELKAAAILGEPLPPLMRTVSLQDAKADPAVHWDKKVSETYKRQERPTLDPMLEQRARELWEAKK